MTNYYPQAWDKLLEINNLSVAQLHAEVLNIGIKASYNTFITWRTNGTMPPEHLVAICNHYRFPISNFVRIAGRESESRDYRHYDEAEWHDICLNTHALINYASTVSRRHRKSAIAKLGCSAAYYDAMRKYPSVPLPKFMSFTNLLAYINNAKMYPGDVILDANLPMPMEYGVRPFFNHDAMDIFDRLYPQPTVTHAAEEIVDVMEFISRYVNSKHMIGDDKMISMSLRTINEIASIIDNLRQENAALRLRIQELTGQ